MEINRVNKFAGNKINGIKAIREFTQENFGVTLGLKEAKDLADNLFAQFAALVAADKEQKHHEVLEALKKTMRVAILEGIVSRNDLYYTVDNA